MNEWLNSLSARERYMVIGCAAFVLLAVLWTFALQPLVSAGSGVEQRVMQKRAQLAGLQELASRVVTADGANRSVAGSSDSLVVIIDRTTREKQLAGYLKRNQPEGPGSVRLRLEGAPFDALVNWLGQLSDRYGLVTTNASIVIRKPK